MKKQNTSAFVSAALAALIVALGTGPVSAVTIAWSPVGNPGNANDPGTNNHWGAVGYNYSIDKYDVTNSQYVEFLNAKDPTGTSTLALYNSNMSSAPYGGINYNSGAASGNKYSVISGDGNHPVTFVTWYDTIRFANWLDNGQGNGDTESGAYTLLGGTPTPSNLLNIPRNAGAKVFLPSESEWYKAAYNIPGTNSYFQNPTTSNSIPIASNPTGLANHANYNNAAGNLTDVGAYTGTTSPYGAFDMAGNVFQWTDSIFEGGPANYTVRGGGFDYNSNAFQSTEESAGSGNYAGADFGFRVASIPEPRSIVLAALGFAGLAAWGWRRRKR